MTDWNRIAAEKAAYRKATAERPIEDKLRTLDHLRERSKSLSSEMARHKDTYSVNGHAAMLTVFGASASLVATARSTVTATPATLFRDKGTSR